MADQLLRTFRFQIKLRKSAAVESGTQTPSDLPTGTNSATEAFRNVPVWKSKWTCRSTSKVDAMTE